VWLTNLGDSPCRFSSDILSVTGSGPIARILGSRLCWRLGRKTIATLVLQPFTPGAVGLGDALTQSKI